MGKRRDTYKYNYRVGREIVHTGITNDLERREGEHQANHDGEGKISKVGNKTTRDAALDWEREQRYKGKPTGP